VVTLPVDFNFSPLAKASTPRMEAISFTRALVSRGLVLCERSWDSLAWRQGWEETWTFEGRVMLFVMVGVGSWELELRMRGKY
jgi:hypothetical protein